MFVFSCSEWIDLNKRQREYLIQVRPPGDYFPLIIRNLATTNNITNPGILHDASVGGYLNTYVMEMKVNSTPLQ